VVPSTAVAVAVTALAEKDRSVLYVLLALPVTVVDDLTGARPYAVGELGGDACRHTRPPARGTAAGRC
jgi:hypothetical protein